MTIPQWALLGFAIWTLLVLFATVSVYRTIRRTLVQRRPFAPVRAAANSKNGSLLRLARFMNVLEQDPREEAGCQKGT